MSYNGEVSDFSKQTLGRLGVPWVNSVKISAIDIGLHLRATTTDRYPLQCHLRSSKKIQEKSGTNKIHVKKKTKGKDKH